MNGLLLCTPECNLRCKYCFEESMHCDKMLPVQEIRKNFDYFIDNYFQKFLEELIEINDKLKRGETDITFHGGEPLLIGHDLLEKACKIIKSYPNTTIGMQTNASLIDNDFIDIISKYGIKMGISIDGPKYMHDAYRVDGANKGTFDRVYKNLLEMKKRGITLGALATVTDVTVKSPEDFYNFFRDNNIDFSFNPCFTDPNIQNTQNSLNTDEYKKFEKKIFDLWINDEKSDISLSCFERIISAMCVKDKIYMEVCSFIPDCSRTTVAIAPDGKFYRCLHYCMDDKNCIGNISEDSLTTALGDEDFKNRCQVMFAGECKDCDIQSYCNAGCPYVSEAEHGTIYSKPNTCECQKSIVHYIYDYYSQFLNDKKRGN